ncbi:unnamed protein product [Phytomonas sp. EM1]|nr:unnamed protein product [Phytomonas sp. EM1]|eukprot:CCW62856.1 unnamed protein product [Phytomonas sp. isolate EM1]
MDAYTTPEYFHCVLDSPFQGNVYEPEADTFLFLDALDQQRSYLSRLLSGKEDCRIVEVGCGSGVVITHLFALLQDIDSLNTFGVEDSRHDEKWSSSVVVHCCRKECSGRTPLHGKRFYAIDVNPLALQATALTWQKTIKKYFWGEIEKLLVQNHTSQDGSSVGVPPPDPNAVDLCAYPSKLEGVEDGSLSIEAVAEETHTDNEGRIETPLRKFQTLWPFTLSLLRGDLLHAFDDLQGLCRVDSCDVILFNPPYVPTSTEELEQALTRKDLITSAWCGGERGRVVLDRFIEMLPRYLSRSGCCYIVLIKENDIPDVYRKIQLEFRRYFNSETKMGEASGILDDQPEEDYDHEMDLMQVVCCAERYTGEYLSIHRISYKENP